MNHNLLPPYEGGPGGVDRGEHPLARFLAIDWEQQQLHVVQASTVRSGVRVEQALSWSFPEPLTAASAETLGKKLREALKEANVPAAPVLACVGRERVILKELRYPKVPANEEPAIVRFQAAKELTESVDDSIIDYVHMGNGASAGASETHSLAVVVKKEVVNSLHGLCRGLGMKLLAVTPRPAAVIGALDRSRKGKVPVGVVEALLTIGPQWADLGVLRGQTLLFARSLGVGPGLAGEVKRSLTVFDNTAESPVQTLFVAGDGEESALCEGLGQSLGLPVQFLDSFLPEDAVQVDKTRRGRFTAAIGLLQRWAEKPQLGINFVTPKEPKIAADPGKRQKVLGAVAAAVIVLVLGLYANYVLAGKKNAVAEWTDQKTEAESRLKNLAQESADINALKGWENASISWLDELYDLTARFPSRKGFRIDSLTASMATKKNSKSKYVAGITITGVSPVSDDTMVHKLVEAINKAGLQATIGRSSANMNIQAFQVKIDLVRQASDKYTTRLTVPPPARNGGAGPGGFGNDNGAFDAQGDDQ